MKKFSILLMIFEFILSVGCGNITNSPISSVDGINTTDLSTPSQVTYNNQKNNDGIEVGNPFFFKNDTEKINYTGSFLFEDVIKKDIELNVNEVANLKDGKVYELKINTIDYIPAERLNLGYFYVQKNKIIKFDATVENVNTLKTSEKIPNDSVIVSQDKEIKDALGKDELGFHQCLEVKENKHEYHSYNNQVSTGYYESFIWEKNKGLTYYRSGFGGEKNSIELRRTETMDNVIETNTTTQPNEPFLFGDADLYINNRPVLNTTYSQLTKDFGTPKNTHEFRINPPACEEDFFYYFKVLKYDGLDCELFLGEEDREEKSSDKIFSFEITSDNVELSCGLKVGMTTDQIFKKFGKMPVYNINSNEDSDLEFILKRYKPENYYSEFSQAMIIYSNQDKCAEPLAKGLILLINNNKLERIVLCYPTME